MANQGSNLSEKDGLLNKWSQRIAEQSVAVLDIEEEAIENKWTDRFNERQAETQRLRNPSIEERTVLSGLHPYDEKERRAAALKRGIDPNYDRPPGRGGLRELGADIVESGVPMAARIGLQTAGEYGGAAVGAAAAPSTAGIVNPATGYIGGGAVGSAGAQGLIEAYANARGMGEPGGGGRIAREAALGAVTSGVGRGIQAATPVVKDFGRYLLDKTPLPKAAQGIKKFMLTNISRMPEQMQKWSHGRLMKIAEIRGGAEEAIEALAGIVKKRINQPLKHAIGEFGKMSTETKKIARYTVGKVNYAGLADEVTEAATHFVGNITQEEVAQGRALAEGVEAVTKEIGQMDDILRRLSGEVPATGGRETEMFAIVRREAIKRRKKAIERYYGYMDDLIRMERDTGQAYAKTTSGGEPTRKTMDAASTFYAAIGAKMKDRMAKDVPGFGLAKNNYTKVMRLSEAVNRYIGLDDDAMLRFMAQGLLAKKNETNFHAKKTVQFLERYSRELGIKPGTFNHARDVVTKLWTEGSDILTSGVKTYLPALAASTVGTAAGGAVGYVAGGATGGKERAAKWGKIGLGVGGAYTAAHMTPAMTAWYYRNLEKTARANFSALGKQIATQGPKLARKPIWDAISIVRERFLAEENQPNQQGE